MKPYYQALKRKLTVEKALVQRKLTEGKSPLPFGILQSLCKYWIKSEEVFGHLYILLSLNLICRTMNTELIQSEHIDWIQDEVGIRLFQGQMGSREVSFKDFASLQEQEALSILSESSIFAAHGQ